MNSKQRRSLKPQIPDYITVKFIKEYLAYIDLIRADDEMAHIEESNLYYILLEAISEGRCEDTEKCAEEALKSGEIEFSRWFA